MGTEKTKNEDLMGYGLILSGNASCITQGVAGSYVEGYLDNRRSHA